jgi:8-oxo-dGTP pyrophosphatase MutT (NUDIX family)
VAQSRPPRRGPWQITGTREVYRNPWIRVREDQVIRPSGQPGIYGVVEMTAAVAVVAVDTAERVSLVGQYRYPTDRYSWEIVTGYAGEGEDPLLGAQRELREETGLEARRWTPLGDCQISNSVTDQIGHLYLAEELTQGAAAPDETEELAVKQVPMAAAVGMAQRGEISDAFSLIGIYRAWHHLRRAGR